jgi:hypothetical protein
MDQTTMRSAPCLEASQALHARLITPAGAAAVQQKALAAQAWRPVSPARPIHKEGQSLWHLGMTTVRQMGLARRHEVNEETVHRRTPPKAPADSVRFYAR